MSNFKIKYMKNKNILIISTNVHELERNIRYLQKNGHNVVVTYTTDGVASYYENSQYDHLNYFDVIIVFSFLGLGIFSGEKGYTDGIDGCWLIYERFLRSLKNTKIIIWTLGRHDREELINAHPSENWDNITFILKDPEDGQQLLRAMKKE